MLFNNNKKRKKETNKKKGRIKKKKKKKQSHIFNFSARLNQQQQKISRSIFLQIDMLDFQKQILTDIVSEDALVITSPGLGLFQILCRFIQLYTKGNHLVLLINTSKEQVDLIQEQLIAHGVSTDHIIRRIEYNTLSEKRYTLLENFLFLYTYRLIP